MNEFVIKNGYISHGDSNIVGSLVVDNDIAISSSIYISGSLYSQDSFYTQYVSSSYTAGQKFVWQSPRGDYRTYIVKTGQTLAAGETPFTNPEKLDRIDSGDILKYESLVPHTASLQGYLVFCQATPNKYFMAHVNASTNIQVATYDTSSRILRNTGTDISVTAIPYSMIYVPSLDEVWSLQGNTTTSTIVRIDNATNTVTGSIALTGFLSATSLSHNLYLDELRGYVYATYGIASNGSFRMERIDIATQAVTGSAITVGGTTIRTGELNVQSGILYLGDTQARFQMINVDTWTNIGNFTDTTNLLSAINVAVINNNTIAVLNSSANISIYNVSVPTSPVHVKNIPRTTRTHIAKYVPELHKIITHSQGITNNNFRTQILIINPDTLEVEDKLDLSSFGVLINNNVTGPTYNQFIINTNLKQIVTNSAFNANSTSNLISYKY